MRPVLFDIPVSLTGALLTLLVIVAGIAVWLVLLRRAGRYTRDHLVTGAAIAGMAVLFLGIIFSVHHFKVNSYGAMLMVGFVTAILVGMRLARRRGIPGERLLDLGLVILIGSVIGARAMYMLISKNGGSEPFIDWGSLLQNGMGGLSFHGGLLGGLLGIIIFVRFTKLRFWRVMDCTAPGVAIGYAITRIGCFLNGCCYGKHCDLPWAVSFPEITSSTGGLIREAITRVHPTQLYATLMGLAMFAILLVLSRGNSLGRAGRLAMVFFMLEGVERFVMEIFREPDPTFHGMLTPAQWLCIGLVILGIAGWFLLPKYPAVDAAPAADAPAPAPNKNATAAGK